MSASDIQNIWLTISQHKRDIIHKDINDASKEGSTFAFPITQEETLALDAECEALMQVRVILKSGAAKTSQIVALKIGDVVKEGVMT